VTRAEHEEEVHRVGAAAGAAMERLVRKQQPHGASAEQGAQSVVAVAGSSAQIAEVAHAHEPAWQDVLEEASQELMPAPPPGAGTPVGATPSSPSVSGLAPGPRLIAGEVGGAGLAALSIGPADAHAVVADLEDAGGIESGLLNVAGDILKGALAAADGPGGLAAHSWVHTRAP